MKKRVTIPALAALLLLQLPFSACEKPEYVDGPDDTTDTGSNVEPVTTFSNNETWSDTLLFQSLGSATWTEDEAIISVAIPVALEAGDRLVTMLQLGLQKPGLACSQNMLVDAGCILDENGTRLPVPADSDSAVIITEEWDGDELMRQFTRYREITITPDEAFTTSVVRAFVRPKSGDAGCSGDVVRVTNCSLIVMVIPGQ